MREEAKLCARELTSKKQASTQTSTPLLNSRHEVVTDFLRHFAVDGQLSLKQTQSEMTGPAEHAGLQGVNEITQEPLTH